MDIAIIAIYFLFMVGLGYALHRLNRAPSDYFRAGGSAPGWLCGSSAFMTLFSAWSFTGAAARIYEDGFLPLALYAANAVGFLVCWRWFSARFRQMRTITYIDGIERRYGVATGRFYVWAQVIYGIVSGAVMMNGLAIFISAAFGIPPPVTVLCVGVVITLTALLGGAWAAMASDFVQLLVVATVAVTAFVLTLADERIGGLGGLWHQLPDRFFSMESTMSPVVAYLWMGALLLNQVIALNNMGDGSAKFLAARDSKAARLTALIPGVGILFGPFIWAVPALAALVLAPNLSEQFPLLRNPHEAAYVATVEAVMPAGFLGLLICGMFAATMSSLDSALNRAAGIVVMNIYVPLKRARQSASQLVSVGKLATAILGLLVTLGGLYVSQWRTIGLFDLVIRMTAMFVLPLAVPLFFGIWLRPLPRGIAVVAALAAVASSIMIALMSPAPHIATWLGVADTLTAREATDLGYVATVFATISISSLILLSGYVWKRWRREDEPEAEAFFNDVATPVTAVTGGESGARIIGICTAWFGTFVCLLAFLPNPPWGRLCFVACGGFMLVVAGVIRRPNRAVPSNEPDAGH